MSVIITGASNDLIEVDGDIVEEFTYSGATTDLIACSDGTVLGIGFDTDGTGNWRITPVVTGPGFAGIEQSTEDDGTDRATVNDVTWVVHGDGIAKK